MKGVLGKSTRALMVVALIGTLAGCATGGSQTPSRSITPSVSDTPTAGGTTSSSDRSLRERLIAGLTATGSTKASLVEKAELTVVPAGWLTGWQIVDVMNSTLAHPQRFYLALSADGSVVNLTGHPDDFNRVVAEADPSVSSADVATGVTDTFLDSTRDFVAYSYRIDEVGDIAWLPRLDEGARQVRERVERTYGPKITRPRARQAGEGWELSVWMVNGNRLIRHDLAVAGNGVVTDNARTVYEGLPVPVSI